MGKYLNSFCRICGTPYHRCNCKSQGSWRKVTDTAEHYQIFCVVRDYTSNIIDAKTAKKLLSNLDLSEKESFRDNVKDILAEIDEKTKVVTKPEVKVQTSKVKHSNVADAIKAAAKEQRKNENKKV